MSKVRLTKSAGEKLKELFRKDDRSKRNMVPDEFAAVLRTMPQTMFAVRITVDGGSAGTVSSTCSYTYTCELDSGFELGTGKSPQKCRLPNTPYFTTAPGSWGAGFYDKDGEFVLWDANECPQVEDPCPEASTELVIDGGDAVTGGGPS